MYPPGYHWILALPTQSFQLDPYLVARYAGAFFGAGLVLAVYVLVRSIAGNPAALLSAFLVSCFPGLYLLQKTGVGAFANQLGLFFIPVVFYFYIIAEENKLEKFPMAYTLLALSLMGLSVSVPMMLIQVLFVMSIIRMSLFIKGNDHRWLKTGLLALATLPAILLLSFHLLYAGPVHQQKTIEVITAGASLNVISSLSESASTETGRIASGGGTVNLKSVWNYPAVGLIRDFFSWKRWGIGHIAANIVGCFILILFGISTVWSIREGKTGLVVLGFWGSIASLQTLTGFLQFSGYQREGWSLLIAFACLSGIIGGIIYGWGKRLFIFKAAVVVTVIISISVSLLYPPAHVLLASCAEDDIIQVARDISSHFTGKRYWSIADRSVDGKPEYLSAFSSRWPLTIVTRKMTGWEGSNQGEMVPTVIHPSERIRVRAISPGESLANFFHDNEQYLILMDEQTKDCNQDNILFSTIDPRQVQSSIDNRLVRYKINDTIRNYVNMLDRNHWQIVQTPVSRNLTAFVVLSTGAQLPANPPAMR
jgi:hypothetical protein